jgi:hypothetical protein
MVPKIRSGQILLQNKPNQRSLVRNCEHYLEMIMSSETTTGPNVMAGDVITQPGLYESRGGDIVQITGWEEGWWVSEWNGTVDWYGSDGRQRFDEGPEPNRWDLLHWVRPLPANEAEPETTTEQLAEIERQATQYTPPEGWRLVETHEELDIPGRDQYVRGPNRYIRPIDPQPQPQPADTADELRSEIHYLQRELAVAKAELATAAAVCQQLQIELDAAQQVPADLPELRQLRLRLADMTLDRDTCKDAYDRIFADLCTIKETTKAEAVEAIVEWLEPVRATIEAADNVAESTRAGWLAEEVIQHLPKIMRHLTGLDSHAID